MQIRTKVVVLVLFVFACWLSQGYLFLGPGPTISAEMAVEQFKNKAPAAENLRLVDTGKNFLVPVAVLVFAFLLFFWEVWWMLGLITSESSCHSCGRKHKE